MTERKNMGRSLYARKTNYQCPWWDSFFFILVQKKKKQKKIKDLSLYDIPVRLIKYDIE